jgi:hypothetical protein
VNVLLRVLAVGCLIAGCTDPAESPIADSDGLPDVPRIFDNVAKIRQLANHAPPRARFLRRAEYMRALKHDELAISAEPAKGALDNHALLRAIGLAAEGPTAPSTEDARMQASDGFYSRRDRTLYVRDDPSRRFPVLEEEVVAHECVHALQDQNGLLPPLDARFSDDAGLARRALTEGDATLGALLYEERDWRTPDRRLAERVMRGFAEKPISRYVGATSPDLATSPPYQQEVVMFPYRGGAAFVASVLAAGGYDLVAKAFASPPVSTAQVLHPERYSRGEQPVVIPAPTLPAGYEAHSAYVLGELLTRSLLLRCNPEPIALKAAEGWRGDIVVTMRAGHEHLTAQQWVTDSEQDARELADALRTNSSCGIAPQRAGESSVSQRGTRVVWAHGGDQKVRAQLADRWLSAALPSPAAARPLGSAELAPNVRPPPTPAPYEAAGFLRYPEAGVELQIPAGFSTEHEHGADLVNEQSHANTLLRLMLGEDFEGAPEQILLMVSRGMAQAIAFSNIIATGKPYPVQTGLGAGVAQDFEHDGTVFGGRVVAIPLCGGTGLLAVIQNYGNGAESALKQALQTLRPLSGSSYCERLSQ